MNCNVHVDLGDRSYPICIGAGGLDSLGGRCAAAGLKGRCLIVTDENVAPLFSECALKSLTAAGFDAKLIILPAGEATKCEAQLFNLYNAAAGKKLDRNSFMVALGGGVIGDLTGYAAASWLRGIRFVQVPTTLLAMVDSSVGGKTGINIPAGKNLVGAFHQPELVLIDLDTLKTLPPRELAAGVAEVVKYGIIHDAKLFDELEENSAGTAGGKVIARCCEIKADIVRQDEHESGLRGILNFGHTLAHAVENVAGYGTFLHGEAVAIGMVYAARLSAKLNKISDADAARIEKLLAAFQLPVRAPAFDWNEIRAAMTLDKKSAGGALKFVLIDRIGAAGFGFEVPETIMKEVWDGIRQ